MFTGGGFAGRAGRAAVVGGATVALALSVTSAASAGAAAGSVTPQAACDRGWHGGVTWYPTGDQVWVDDLCGDGYAVRASIYQLARDQGGTYWQYTGLQATAYANGETDIQSKNLLEGVRIRIHAYLLNRNGTACHHNWYRTDWGDYLTTGNEQNHSQFFVTC